MKEQPESVVSMVLASDIDMDQCRVDLEEAAFLLSHPGAIQIGIGKSAEHGPLAKTLSRELLHLAVDVSLADDRDSEESQKAITLFGEKSKALQMISWDFLNKAMSKAAFAIQALPMEELTFNNVEEEDQIHESRKEMFASIAKNNEGSNIEGVVSQVHPHVATIIKSGIMAAGGEEAFIAMQIETIKSLPDEAKAMPSAQVAAQVVATTIKAIAARAFTVEMVKYSSVSTIETIIMAERTLTLPLIADWSRTPAAIYAQLAKMSMDYLDYSVSDEEEAPGYNAEGGEQTAPIKPESTVHAGNETIN